MSRRMITMLVALSSALLVVVTVVFLAPTVSWIANGQNIVSSDENAATYVGAAVGFFGTFLGAAAILIAYEVQKSDQHEIKASVCALRVKTAMRASLEEMFNIFELGITAIPQSQRSRIIGGTCDQTLVVSNAQTAQVTQFLQRCANVSSTMALDADAAEALAHLDRGLMTLFLRAHAALERVRFGARPVLPVDEFKYVIHWVESATDCMLQLNSRLNDLVMPNAPERVVAQSTAAWLNEDNVPLPT